jgi:hypothetical protein
MQINKVKQKYSLGFKETVGYLVELGHGAAIHQKGVRILEQDPEQCLASILRNTYGQNLIRVKNESKSLAFRDFHIKESKESSL